MYCLTALLIFLAMSGPPVNTPRELVVKNESDRVTNVLSFPSCSASQFDIIRHQLPPEECNSTRTSPWEQKCSYSYATRCPDAVWLKDYYQQRYYKPTIDPNLHNVYRPFVAMYIGCNKGMDAVNTLRMGSGNADIDKNLWRTTFLGTGQKAKLHPGVCQQELEEQFLIPPSSKTIDPRAQVHCIEAMPSTARKLSGAAKKLGWEKWLKVQNLAMNDQDGTTLFPDHDAVVGIENKGIKSCEEQENTTNCKEVPTLRLDSYTQKYGLEKSVIDVLSVDVEGFDWAVISSGKETLARTNYLEFEYNWMGPWGKQSLKDSLTELKDQGFICYWPGRFGHIWRLTDCWQDYYDLKFWSNVACVKAGSQVELANRMEYMFQMTLAKNRTIQYDKFVREAVPE